jgi:hypothetical protein
VLHFVQYHNPERYGPPGKPAPGEPFWIATSKPARRLPGSCVWLILGEGRPRRYSLYEVFIAGWVEPILEADFLYRIAGREGIHFDPPVEVTFYPWFQAMKRSLGNFSLGLTEITDTYARYLITLAREFAPESLVFQYPTGK